MPPPGKILKVRCQEIEFEDTLTVNQILFILIYA